jgi:diguanylate cyclase (GGDEF)-like protein
MSASGAIVGVVETFSDDSARVSAVERANEMERLAYVDALTALPNRRYAEATLSARFNEMRRFGWTFGVIFIDLDRFKRINDTYSHEVGDRVLAMVAKTLVTNVRSFDVVSRWGGEEFLCIIGHVNQSQLDTVAEKLRALVQQSNLTLGETQIGVTISAGATQAQITDSAELLIERADRLMYLSKAAGRNRVSSSLGKNDFGSR